MRLPSSLITHYSLYRSASLRSLRFHLFEAISSLGGLKICILRCAALSSSLNILSGQYLKSDLAFYTRFFRIHPLR